MPKPRDYKDEYAKFQSSPSSKKDRASRNKMRRLMIKKGAVSKGDNKDVDHKNGNPKDNRMSNLRIVHRSVNRAKH
jgi:hypothetical protein